MSRQTVLAPFHSALLAGLGLSALMFTSGIHTPVARGACCYFAAKDKDVSQPAQKAFVCWDEVEKVECFTVQPKFEGNAGDFGMVIPTPAKPKLDEMPRDFFKELAVFTILSKREYPESKLLPRPPARSLFGASSADPFTATGVPPTTRPSVRVLESGIVGSLDYKIIVADKADDLYQWLKDNRYNYAGDEAALDFYIKKGWFFTVMKIDAKQMKPRPDGTYDGDVTPTRFQFQSERCVYPLRITKISVKDSTEALLYVQAPYKVDLPGDWTYQYQWIPMLQNAKGWYAKGIFGPDELPGRADQWLTASKDKAPELLAKGQTLGFNFVSGQRPQPNGDGRIATTLEWAKKLTDEDLKVLSGEAPYTQSLPDVDAGFDAAELAKDSKKAQEAYKVIQSRLDKDRKDHPGGYLVREAPKEDLDKLKLLKGHLKSGQFVTKIRKTFTKAEMDDDLLIVPAKVGDAEDKSEYTEVLPTSPP
jgi:hypothetical protein